MTVLDASVVTAALFDAGRDGGWARELLAGSPLIAPHLLPVEVTQVVRRLVIGKVISADVAAIALADLADLAIPLFDFAPCADRVWELRETVSAYDAWYVALAELVDTSLATLDRRLARANGPWCQFVLPPGRR